MTLFMMRKLVTREDARILHGHKALGALALGHFAYRVHRGFTAGDLGFGPDVETAMWVALHAALSLSSMVFHVPSNRVRGSPMIWPEGRLHSIGFTLRSVVIVLLYAWSWRSGWSVWMEHARAFVVLATMAWADAVTAHHTRLRMAGQDAPAATTMRGMPYPPGTPGAVRAGMQLFYAGSQGLATVTLLMGSRVDAPFLMLMPIQLAVFLMTLVRKGLIGAWAWHAWYSAAILLPYAYTLYRDWAFPDVHCFPLGETEFAGQLLALAAFMLLRVAAGVDKYVFWGGLIVAKTVAMTRFGAFRMGGWVHDGLCS